MTSAPQPRTNPPIPDVPSALKPYRQWILWKLEARPGGGKPTKKPLASVTDPAQWMEYETARALANADPSLGLGFVFTAADPFVFVDIDNCGAPGAWNADALAAFEALPGAAWETSQSAQGLHAVLYAPDASERLKHKRNRFTLPGGTKAEFYTHGRYMALGGGEWKNAFSLDARKDATVALEAWLPDREDGAPTEAALAPSGGPRPGYSGPADDAELIEKARKATGPAAAAFGERATFEQLWNGDALALGHFFPAEDGGEGFDHSLADMALMSRLAWWTGCDHARMDRLFSRSALGQREKWTGRADYRTRTIAAATKPDTPYMGSDRAAANDGGEAEESEPQDLLRPLREGRPYPVEALGPLQAAVEAVQRKTQAPVAIAAQSALGVASLAVQGFANVETLGGERPLSLFLLTIAKSGERKSACDAPFIEAVRRFECEEMSSFRAKELKWKNAEALHKGERDALLKPGKDKDIAAAQAKLDDLGPEPQRPAQPERTVSEPTFEGLTKLFEVAQPSLGLFSDEGGQFLGGHAMGRDHRQKTLAAFNDLWQGNPIRRTRSGDGHRTLYGRRLAMHLMVQPSVAEAFMADPMTADTGFLPRFLICRPPSNIGKRMHSGARHDEAPLRELADRVRRALQTPMPMDADTRALKPRSLGMTAEARALLVEYADAVEAAQRQGEPYAQITGAASKSAEQAARIAGVLTLWESLSAERIEVQIMANAIALARYYLDEAARLAEAAIIPPEIQRAETLRIWLLERWAHPEVTKRDMMRQGPNALRDAKTLGSAVNTLQQYGWLKPLEPGTVVRGSKRQEAWRIVRPGSG